MSSIITQTEVSCFLWVFIINTPHPLSQLVALSKINYVSSSSFQCQRLTFKMLVNLPIICDYISNWRSLSPAYNHQEKVIYHFEVLQKKPNKFLNAGVCSPFRKSGWNWNMRWGSRWDLPVEGSGWCVRPKWLLSTSGPAACRNKTQIWDKRDYRRQEIKTGMIDVGLKCCLWVIMFWVQIQPETVVTCSSSYKRLCCRSLCYIQMWRKPFKMKMQICVLQHFFHLNSK